VCHESIMLECHWSVDRRVGPALSTAVVGRLRRPQVPAIALTGRPPSVIVP
jgi:hypothetical protein